MAAYFSATNASGVQLYKLGFDGSVTQWTANPGSGGGLDPQDLTFFNNAVWFGGDTPANGFQLFKLGNDGSVTTWTSIGNALDPVDLTVFNNALWFNGIAGPGQFQLYKLGNDGSVTKWTADPGIMGGGLDPMNMTVFNDALWFHGDTPANGAQLFKLGNDGSVTKWTSIGTNLDPLDFALFTNRLCVYRFNPAAVLARRYQLGAGGSVTECAADRGIGNGLDPMNMTDFSGALWFEGVTPANGTQLFKLGNDGSVTKWTNIGTDLFPDD